MRSTAARPNTGIICSTSRDSAGNVRWRLMASNGRAFGISSGTYASSPEALDALQKLRGAGENLVVNIGHPESGVGWLWAAQDPLTGVTVARSARSYERRATCVQGFERFVLALGQLPIA